MEAGQQRATDGLDRLLALRPEDLDGWEESAAAELDSGERSTTEALDASFAALIDDWNAALEAEPGPELTAAAFVGLSQDDPEDSAAMPPSRRRHGRLGRQSALGTALAMAAALAIMAFSTWQVGRIAAPGPDSGLKAVTSARSASVDLQFSVERTLATSVAVEPGRDHGSYGSADRLQMRVVVEGDGGWLYVLEVPASGKLVPITSERVTAGVHSIGGGATWQPDQLAGSTTYLAVVTSEPFPDLPPVAAVLMSPERSDLWPHQVLAADMFAVDWEADGSH